MNYAQKFVIVAISKYQENGGGDEIFRVSCNFEPSCSEFAKQAVCKHGALRGLVMSTRRILRCSARDIVMKINDPVP
ncbi:MAG: membrane protein insertion efficiency factor YidD [Gammaproteobacteria bacterium]